MKKLIATISFMLAFLANSQVKVTNATGPNFNDGAVSVDTTGTKIKKWSIYRVVDAAIQGSELATNFKTKGGLVSGTYWVLGKKKDDGLSKFSLDTLINISIAVTKDCDSLKVTSFNVMQMPDPQNPQNGQTCIYFSIDKANYAMIDKVYTKNWDNTFTQYYGPNQGGCFMNLYNPKLYVVFTDANGCSVVGTNNKEYKPTGVPIMIVPGTEPGPITNYVALGFTDCSGYYISYDNTQYKICNYAAAQAAGIVHLDSIIVSGKFLSDCNDNTPVCQMYHPYAGYFWLDSVRAIPTRPNATNCWDDYQFNIKTLVWDNKGTKPTQPIKTNCWDNYQFNSTSCTWVNNGTQPTQPTKTNCWDNYQFDATACAWTNNGIQPNKPTSTNCWDNYQFNSTSCSWVNGGSKPLQPKDTNCWDNYQFDATACAWSNKGSQPLQPTDTIYVYQFDSVKCLWDNIGLKDSSSLSLREQELKELFWPNPFNDRIEISLTPGSYGTFTNIEGKTIQVFEGGTISIDTQILQPGTYFLNITKDRQTISLKAIKN